jgi:hypothetical protein
MSDTSMVYRILEFTAICASIFGATVIIINWSRSKTDPQSDIVYPRPVFYTVIRYIGYVAIVIWTWCAMLRIGGRKPIFDPEDYIVTSSGFVFIVFLLLGSLLIWFLFIETSAADVFRKGGKGLLRLIIYLLFILMATVAYVIDTLQVFGLISLKS